MWLDKLGKELTKLDRELLSFTKAVDSRKQAIINDTLNKNAKYQIGYEFNHPQYGSAKIVGFYFNPDKQCSLLDDGNKSIYDDPYMFWPDFKSFYEPWFLYKCEVQVEGLGLGTTNVPEHVIDKSLNNNVDN
jgi:hypothetical protein